MGARGDRIAPRVGAPDVTAPSVADTWRARFSQGEYDERYARLRQRMDEASLDCLLVYGSPLFFGSDGGSPNLTYLAGYAPSVHGYLVFPRDADPTLIIFAGNHVTNAREVGVISDVRAARAIEDAVVVRVRELGRDGPKVGIVGNFGWCGASIPVEHYRTFVDAFGAGAVEVVTEWFELGRLTKSVEEIRVLREAAAICDEAQEHMRGLAVPGAVDVALQNRVWSLVHDRGGRTAFGHVQPTPMEHPEMQYPSYYPVGRVVAAGDAIMSELTAGLGGYFGKLFGTMFVGQPTASYSEMFHLAADIRREIYESATPGMPARELGRLLDGDAAKFGYESSSHLAGWSTYNTPPAYNPRADDSELDMPLTPGICFSVVGWVRTRDRTSAVWLGDTAIMTDDGLSSLHHYPIDDIAHATL